MLELYSIRNCLIVIILFFTILIFEVDFWGRSTSPRISYQQRLVSWRRFVVYRYACLLCLVVLIQRSFVIRMYSLPSSSVIYISVIPENSYVLGVCYGAHALDASWADLLIIACLIYVLWDLTLDFYAL